MLNIRIDDSEITRLAERAALLTDRQLRFAVASAMTAAGRAAQKELRDQTPRFVDKPTSWTLGGIFQRPYAKAEGLTISLGFATERRGLGNPAGRYLNPMTAGTTPRFKAADLSASSIAGVSRAALIPARSAGLINAAGNVPLRKQIEILAKARSGARSGVFIAPVKRGSKTMAIFQRTEGFIPRSSTLEGNIQRLFTLDTSPKARGRTLPVERIVMAGFTSAWGKAIDESIRAEITRALGK